MLLGVKEELAQALRKLSEMGEQLKASETRMEEDKMAMAQERSDREEEVRILIQERDHLRQERDALQLEMVEVQDKIQATESMVRQELFLLLCLAALARWQRWHTVCS